MDSEWIGGIVTMPHYVAGEGEPFRPEVLLWLDTDGLIRGSAVARPGELLPMASDVLQRAMEQPLYGSPLVPVRVRVASPELAEAVRVGHPEVDVVCAPTPELDEMAEQMLESMGGAGAGEHSYLSPGIEPDAMGSLFAAAADLFRARPWKLVPGDACLLRVDIDQLGVRGAALSVIGQLGQHLGFVLFPSLDDFECYVDAADVMALGEQPEMPPHLALSFTSRTEVEPELREEVREHRWEIADAAAFPWPLAVDGTGDARPLTAAEVTLVEAVARALAAVAAARSDLRKAWDGGKPVSTTIAVPTHGGAVDVAVSAPFPRAPVTVRPPDDVLGRLAALGRNRRGIDDRAREALEDELLRGLDAAAGAKGEDRTWACRLVTTFAADYLGETIATLGATGLREVLFEILPRKAAVEPSEAGEIVAQCRALYDFLGRELGLEQADSCVRALGRNAVTKLAAALADRSRFGMAKSLFLAGRDAGFDMHTKEGVDAWRRWLQDKPSPISSRAASRPRSGKAAKAAKKRKAARKARRRRR